ncbi:MAG: hypothetical protein QOH41_3987 [Blastocatellia bacterium]|jgi:hypothetical protein|nr:hypothetical protein [Blastocatellia bacterium]
MELNNTFQKFSDLLNERFRRDVYTTEDSIRYTFYAALLSTTELEPIDLILEHNHPGIQGAQIDTVITGSNGIAVEFKYDRGNPGGSNQNRTLRAAAVMADIFRLVKVPSSLATEKYFIYITDSEMARYFRNPTNRLQEFFELTGTAQFSITSSRFQSSSPTFTTRIAPLVCDCAVVSVYSADLAGGHCFRAFQVLAEQIV